MGLPARLKNIDARWLNLPNRTELPRFHRRLRPARVLVASFASIILLGTILLRLPLSSVGAPLSFVDALFTATSATCVTGLIVVDTGARFTLFGQLVILALIQIGGLGIMTLSTFFMYLLAGKFSIRGRDIVQETLSQRPVRNLSSLLWTIFLFTLFVETIGALLLTLGFLTRFPLNKAIYLGIFHSISAFCNAGFSLFADSFMQFGGHWLINVTLMCLIVLGGLGFVVLFDLTPGWRKNRAHYGLGLSFHSRLVFMVTFYLLVVGATIFFVFEYKNTLKGLPVTTQMLASCFQSVTSRTAGFNTLNIASLTNSTLFFLILLMFIGASPGSCGGGIKTTTFWVLITMLFARFRNREDVNIFHRQVPQEIISRSISIAFFSISIIILFTLILLMTEIGEVSNLNSRGLFLEILFEVASAFGTVGLSMGVTPSLTNIGKILLTLVMFIGRLGPLTIALAVGGEASPRFRYAQEKFLVG